MQKTNNKQIIVLTTAVVVGLTIIGGSFYYAKGKPSVSIRQEAQASPPTSSTITQVQEFTLTPQPSPFAIQPTGGSIQQPGSPPIPSAPGSLFPGLNAEQGFQQVQVKAILTSNGKTIAVLSLGQDERINVSEGEKTKLGTVTSITKEGVYIDKTFYPLQRGVTETSSPPIKSQQGISPILPNGGMI